MSDEPRARLLVSFDLLRNLLHLPHGVSIVGAEVADEFIVVGCSPHTCGFTIVGEGVPDIAGGDCDAEFSDKPKFDRFRPITR